MDLDLGDVVIGGVMFVSDCLDCFESRQVCYYYCCLFGF